MPGDPLLEAFEAGDPLMEAFEAGPPRMQQRRRTVLGVTDVMSGEADTASDRQVVDDVEVDADAELAPVKAEAPTGPTEAQASEWSRRTDAEVSPYWDALLATGPGGSFTPRGQEARQRTGRRLSRWWEGAQRDPAGTAAASIVGAGEGASMGLIPEITALAETPEVAVDPFGLVSDAPERFGSRLDAARADLETLSDVNPEAFSAGEDVGMAAGVLGGPSIAARQGAGRLARVGAGAATGALYGGVGAIGAADPESLSEAALAGGEGAALGAALGGGLSGVAEGAGAARQRALPRLSRSRDEALLGATASAGRGQSAIDRFSRGTNPRAIRESRAAAAETLRQTGAIPRVGSIDRVASGIDDAFERSTQTMDDIRSAMDGGGPTYAEVADALRARAAQVRGVEGQPIREMLESRAEQYAAQGHVPMDYDLLIEEARNLRALGQGRTRTGTIPLGQQALDHVDSTLRGAYDDAIEAQLGPAERAAYQRARREYATLLTAGMNAERGVAASAGNRLMGMSENQAAIAAAAAGQRPVEGLASTLAANTLRRYEPTLRASGAEILYQLARERPESLGRWGQTILEAAARGTAALAATAHVAAQQDPEIRRLLAEQEE